MSLKDDDAWTYSTNLRKNYVLWLYGIQYYYEPKCWRGFTTISQTENPTKPSKIVQFWEMWYLKTKKNKSFTRTLMIKYALQHIIQISYGRWIFWVGWKKNGKYWTISSTSILYYFTYILYFFLQKQDVIQTAQLITSLAFINWRGPSSILNRL